MFETKFARERHAYTHTHIYAHEETKNIKEYIFQTNKIISN